MLEIKEIINGDLLMEIETIENKNFNTIEKIKKYVNELNIQIDKSNYFVKKAEIELNKII